MRERHSIAQVPTARMATASQQDIYEVYPRNNWRKVGNGSFGSVYKVINRAGGVVAVKRFDKTANMASQDFHAELSVLTTPTAHPGLPLVFGAYDNPGYFYIVMEYFKQGNLADIFEKRPDYNEKDVRDIVEQLAEVLKHCLDAGIVHRDVKLDNIMVTKWEPFVYIKLTDFMFSGNTGLRRGKTVLTTCLGTLGYQAPEVYEASRTYVKRRNEIVHGRPNADGTRAVFNYKCDVWSVGCITYTLLSGGLEPFRVLYSDIENLIEEVSVENITEELAGRYVEIFVEDHALKKKVSFMPRPVWAKVTDEAQKLVKHMLQQNPKERATYDEILESEWMEKN